MTATRTSLTIAAAALTAILAACSGTSAPAAHPASVAAAPSCHRQYLAWKSGPVNAVTYGQLKPAILQVQSAAASTDLLLLRSSLEAVGSAAAKMKAYPIPACADPKGYWDQFLSLLRAAGDNAKTSSGLGALILAEAPLQQVPAVEAKLTAELKQTGAQ